MKIHAATLLFIFIAQVLIGCAPVSQQDLQETVEIAIALTALAQTASAPVATTAVPLVATVEPTTEPPAPIATEAAASPEVVFLAEGSFGAEEKSQITSRVVEPFILYYHDLTDHPTLLTVSIEKVDGLSGYPYSAEAIFKTGINSGWLIPATGGIVDWWIPECMGPCFLSDNFRATYPEIVAILEP